MAAKEKELHPNRLNHESEKTFTLDSIAACCVVVLRMRHQREESEQQEECHHVGKPAGRRRE